jgi:hypothetical protein
MLHLSNHIELMPHFKGVIIISRSNVNIISNEMRKNNDIWFGFLVRMWAIHYHHVHFVTFCGPCPNFHIITIHKNDFIYYCHKMVWQMIILMITRLYVGLKFIMKTCEKISHRLGLICIFGSWILIQLHVFVLICTTYVYI